MFRISKKINPYLYTFIEFIYWKIVYNNISNIYFTFYVKNETHAHKYLYILINVQI